MRAGAAACLGSVQGQVPVLEEVRADVTVNDLMVEAEMTQRYRNLEATNIEAVYTFPLPLDAVLLGFDVEIGDRKLAGTVVEKRKRSSMATLRCCSSKRNRDCSLRASATCCRARRP